VQVPRDALLRALTSLDRYVVLRNHDILGSLAKGGDVDLLVADARAAERLLVAELGGPVCVARRSYVTSLSYDWGHLDLLPSLEWRGAKYLDTDDVCDSRTLSSLGLPRPRLAHEALASWFSSLLWGGFFKARYRNDIVDAAQQDGDELRRVLRVAAGRRWGRRLWRAAAEGRPEESAAWVASVRRAVWLQALRRAPLRTTAGALRFGIAEAKLHLRPPLPWVAVLGPDGSGKSTVLARLRDAWPATLGAVHTYHLRPRRLTSRRVSAEPVVDPHGQHPRPAVTSALALAYVVVDWWFGYWTGVVRRRVKQGLVVFDRHFLDMQIDPRRYRYGGPAWLLRAAGRLVPRPDVIVVLDAPPEVVRGRKQEITAEESDRQHLAYRTLAERLPEAHLVDATRSPDQVVDAVLTLLRAHRRGPAA
jgi:thymidylate kinase